MSFTLCRLDLHAFRNHRQRRFDVPERGSVVITGVNGSGKTNVLEAISLLTPGRGLRGARFGRLQNDAISAPWAISGHGHGKQGAVHISTGGAPTSPEKRIFMLDGMPARTRQEVAAHGSIVWMIPAMDGVLGEGTSARRALLDRLTVNFDPTTSDSLRTYDKAMRERATLLRQGREGTGAGMVGRYDTAWLNALEDTMARMAVIIAFARERWVSCLNAAMPAVLGASGFPEARVSLSGTAEEALADGQAALLIEDDLRARLAQGRTLDAQSGITQIGAHRTLMNVCFATTNRPAEEGSTGEQKALLLAIILAHVHILSRAQGHKPLVLLDDVLDHLDVRRHRALASIVQALGVQAWLTGTNGEAFAPFRDAHRIALDDQLD